MESWRRVWREAIAPQMSTPGLEGLLDALVTDDPRLLQGATTCPPPLQCVQDWPVEGGCGVGYPGAVENGGFKGAPKPATVAEVEEFFATVCFKCDQITGEPASCRYFLNWFDETPRDEMRRKFTPEVQRELSRRAELANAS